MIIVWQIEMEVICGVFFSVLVHIVRILIFNANSDRHELSQLKKPGRKRITVSFSSSFIVWPLDLC